MPTSLSPRAIHPARVQAARRRLLDKPALSFTERVCAVFCEPTRSQIVRALSAGPLPVTDLALTIGRSRSVISQHLRILREDHIVQSRRRGRAVNYGLTNAPETRTSLQTLDVVARAAPQLE